MAGRVITHVGNSKDIIDKLETGAIQIGAAKDALMFHASQEGLTGIRESNRNLFTFHQGEMRLALLERKIDELVDKVNECCSRDNREIPVATPFHEPVLAVPVYKSEPRANTRRRSVRNNSLTQEASRQIGNTVLRGTNNTRGSRLSQEDSVRRTNNSGTRRNTIPQEAFLRMGEVLHQNSPRNRSMLLTQQQIDELDDQELARLHDFDLGVITLDKLLPPNVSRRLFYSLKKQIDEHRAFNGKYTEFNDEIEVYRNMTTRKLLGLISENLVTRTQSKDLIFKVVELLRIKRYEIRQKFKAEQKGWLVIENRPELEKEYEFLEKKSP